MDWNTTPLWTNLHKNICGTKWYFEFMTIFVSVHFFGGHPIFCIWHLFVIRHIYLKIWWYFCSWYLMFVFNTISIYFITYWLLHMHISSSMFSCIIVNIMSNYLSIFHSTFFPDPSYPINNESSTRQWHEAIQIF